MGRNAQRRRAARDAGKLRRKAQRPPRIEKQPTVYLRLPEYLVQQKFAKTKREAMAMLMAGRVNVNGKVWSYPDVPKRTIERDQFGRLKIMVEGIVDPRPVDDSLVLRSGANPKRRTA